MAASIAAMSSAVRRAAASSTAGGSSSSRTSKSLRASVAPMRATWTLRWVSRSTRPSLLSLRIASRSGVMLMFSDVGQLVLSQPGARGEVAGQDPPAQLGVGDVALARQDVRLGHDLAPPASNCLL